MTFDNKKKAIKLRFSSFLMVIAAIVIILILVYTRITEPLENAGISKNALILAVVGLLICVWVWRYILDLHYIYFSDDGTDITIRFYSLRPFTSSKNAVVIDKERFQGYKIKKVLFGFKPYIILSVSNNFDKTVQYPPISLSGLNKKQRNKMLKSLKKL
jgi:hypothetical protein